MGKNYLTECEYWQVRMTGEIMTVPKGERSAEWMKAYRPVRLLHHPESCCVFVEDATTNLSALDDPCVVELDIENYKYWKMIYENPEI